jgi:hypothetical protein
VDIGGGGTDLEFGTHHDDHRLHLNGMTDRGFENTTYLGSFINSDWQIVLPVTVNSEASLRNDDPRLRMVLGVQREDSRGPDYKVIEIGPFLIESDVVEHEPVCLVQLSQATTDGLLSDCAHSVRPLVGMNLQESGKTGSHRFLCAQLVRLGTSALASLVAY